jgi:hypothetical protein
MHNAAGQAADSPEKNKPDRERFYSADVTVATSTATPPGTPESFLETIPQEETAKITEETLRDLETPSIRQANGSAIEAVHECPSAEKQLSPSPSADVNETQLQEPYTKKLRMLRIWLDHHHHSSSKNNHQKKMRNKMAKHLYREDSC